MKYETISSYLEPESEADGARLLAAGESFRLRADRLAGSWVPQSTSTEKLRSRVLVSTARIRATK